MSKKKRKQIKIEEELVYDFNNERSLELFNKMEYQLSTSERIVLSEYIYDYIHPKWRPVIIDGIQTMYEVSNSGIVRNVLKSTIIKPTIDNDGYARVRLSTPVGSKGIFVHRLVGFAFIPNPENKPQINHIYATKLCNWVKNLEWCTNKENIEHAIRMGLEPQLGRRGEDNNKNVYTETQIRKACELMQNINNRPKYICSITGVDRLTQQRIREKRTWTHVSKDYNIPEANFREGELNNNYTYTSEQIHEICRLLENPNNTPTKVAKMVGVPPTFVQRLRLGNCHENISSQYNIDRTHYTGENKVQAVYKNEQIERVCQMLKNPYISYPEIKEKTGVKIDMISRISQHRGWNFIADKYGEFPPRTNRKTERILELYSQGKSYPQIYEDMQDEFFQGIGRRRGTWQVGDVIRRLIKRKENEKLECPSTIEKTSKDVTE